MDRTVIFKWKGDAPDGGARIAEGATYERVFEASAESFEASGEEWPAIERSGLFEFVEVREAEPATKKTAKKAVKKDAKKEKEG